MDIRDSFKYLFNVFVLFEVQKQVNCMFLKRTPCCGYESLPLYSDQNSFSINNAFQLNKALFSSPDSDPVSYVQNSFGVITPSAFSNTQEINPESVKAYECSLISCLDEIVETGVCACNYNTGNVVTFKNNCDVKKHNCRFDTEFNVILNDICPWEFKSRRSDSALEIDYSDPKYYNK
ncbi:uncharacterized protein LOC116773904 [Danaus plexippus]|uniref:uncharacterized protein LOC116773904 n=1 Tax=Danaus plexippus TaxID=13037 RepID=UPI0013C42636|nr:uncharacterized protein LOC116773904 [Danaus plexippus]